MIDPEAMWSWLKGRGWDWNASSEHLSPENSNPIPVIKDNKVSSKDALRLLVSLGYGDDRQNSGSRFLTCCRHRKSENSIVVVQIDEDGNVDLGAIVESVIQCEKRPASRDDDEPLWLD